MDTSKNDTSLARSVWVIGLNAAALILCLVVLFMARAAIAIILVAFLLAVAANPVVEWLQRRKFPRMAAVFTVVGILLLLLALLVFSLVPMLIEQGKAMAQSAPYLADKLQHSPPLEWMQERFNLVEETKLFLKEHGGAVAGGLLGAAWSALGIMAGLVTAVFLAIFMLISGKDLGASILDMLPPEGRARYSEMFARVQTTVGRFILGTFFVASIGAIVVTLSTWILGVPYFLPLGGYMLFAGVVPYIGPISGAILTIGMTLATVGWAKAFAMAIIFVVYQFTENNVLQPVIQRRTIKLNPVTVIIAMMLGVSLAGIVGAVLALPVAGTIKAVFGKHLPGRKT